MRFERLEQFLDALMSSSISPTLLIASLMVASTPIMLAAIGELVVERAGVLNLGVEGMMITGAVCGFIVGVTTNSPAIGFLGAAAGGAILSMLFAVLTQLLLSNQVATGLALTLFGLGLSALMGQSWIGIKSPTLQRIDLGPLTDLPFVGRVIFGHDPMVYVALGIVAGVWAFFRFTRAGLIVRAVGENHDAAHALGYNVVLIRFLAIGFGGVTVLQLNLQAAGVAIPVEYLSMSPYIATIVVLVIMSAGRAPGSLGRTFHAST